MNWKDKIVVVTGGTGFLGSHIIDCLKIKGCRNIYTPDHKSNWDFRNLEDANLYFTEHQPDIVFNCAANQGGLGYHREKPGTIYYDNLLMGANTMEAARRCESISKYVNIIAGCSYPDSDGLLKEANYWDGALHPSVINYGITKKIQTIQGLTYKKQYDFNSIHLILQNMYGEREHFEPDRSHALAALIVKCHQAKINKDKSITMWGTGKPIREWLYVKDAAKAIVMSAEKYNDIDPMNISCDNACTMDELVHIIAEIVGFKGKILHDTTQPDGTMIKKMNNAKMLNVLGWQPDTDIKIGIKNTYDWYRKSLHKDIDTDYGLCG